MNLAWPTIWRKRTEAPVRRASVDVTRLDMVDDALIDDVTAVQACLQSLTDSRSLVVLQGPDQVVESVARLVSGGANGLLLALQGDACDDTLPAQFNVKASSERGLLLFTLRDARRGPSGLLHAPWPDTLLHVQSRRHFRVIPRLDEAWLSWPHLTQRWPLHDISEAGIGLWLPANQALPLQQGDPALLHLNGLRLMVPTLAAAHGAPEELMGVRQRVGLHLVGMSGPDTRALRCWLMTQQALSLVRRPNQV